MDCVVNKLSLAVGQTHTWTGGSPPSLQHCCTVMMCCGFYCCYFLRRIQFADYAVVEIFEEAEGRNPGQTSIDDLPKVLKLRKEVLEKHVMCYFVTSSYFIQTESN